MKRLLYVMMLCLGVTGFVACSVDTESEASATIPYVGQCDSIVFDNVQDTVFEWYIRDVIASKTIPLVGDNSIFSESFTTKDEFYQNAVANCNLQALRTYETMVNNVSSRIMRSTMETLYGDSVDFSPLGYLTVYYSLYGFVNEQNLHIGTTYKGYATLN